VLREGVYALFGSAAELCFFVPNLSFPKRKLPADRVNNTLLLGELIRDPVAPAASSADAATPTTSNMQSRLLVTDLLIMSQTLLLTLMPLEQRLSTLEAELIQPLKALQATLPATAHSEMHVRAKAHFALAKAESVLRMAVPHVHQGLTLRMSGKDKDAAKSVGFQFTWRKDAPGNVSEADILKFAAAFKK
jgi:Asp-tRNA(Asn)/Glu-tRNA(Gln) amidotransferase A subunit family amidase